MKHEPITSSCAKLIETVQLNSQGKTNPGCKHQGLLFTLDRTSEAHSSWSLWCTTKSTQTHSMQVFKTGEGNRRYLCKYVPGTALPSVICSCLQHLHGSSCCGARQEQPGRSSGSVCSTTGPAATTVPRPPVQEHSPS